MVCYAVHTNCSQFGSSPVGYEKCATGSLENTKPPPSSFKRVRNSNSSAEESEVIRKHLAKL